MCMSVHRAIWPVPATWAGKSMGPVPSYLRAFWDRSRQFAWGVMYTSWLLVALPRVCVRNTVPSRWICLPLVAISFSVVTARWYL